MPSADFLTIDVYDHPIRRAPARRRAARAALAAPIPGRSTGGLGRDADSYPDLPPTAR